MAKIENIEDIAASLPEWEFLKQLPETIGSFVKTPGRGIEGKSSLSSVMWMRRTIEP